MIEVTIDRCGLIIDRTLIVNICILVLRFIIYNLQFFYIKHSFFNKKKPWVACVSFGRCIIDVYKTRFLAVFLYTICDDCS